MKPKRKYIRVKDRRVGLAVKDRTKVSERNANQWTLTPKQELFADYYFNPSSITFSNALQSALRAGYSRNHAVMITSNVLSLEWVREAKSRLSNWKPEHIYKKYEQLANGAGKDADKLHALDSMAKISGMFIDRSIQQIDVQFTNSVPRPVIDATSSVDDNSVTSTVTDTPVK